MEPRHARAEVPGFFGRLVTEDPDDWGPAGTIQAAAGALLFGADPGIILDETDDARALAVSAALELALRMDRNRRIDLANKLGEVLSGT